MVSADAPNLTFVDAPVDPAAESGEPPTLVEGGSDVLPPSCEPTWVDAASGPTESDLDSESDLADPALHAAAMHGLYAPRPERPWFKALIGSSAAAWLVSVTAHAAACTGALMIAGAFIGRPAEIRFGRGDGGATLGMMDRPGLPDLDPGRAGQQTDSILPPGAAAPAAEVPPAEHPPEANEHPTPPVPATPPPMPADAIEPAEDAPPPVPAKPEESVLAAAAVPPTPKREWKFPEQPEAMPAAARQPPTTMPADPAAVADASSGKPADAADPSATAGAKQSIASATGTGGDAGNTAGGGDGSRAGQGGGTIGDGGTDLSGRPGSPAGYPEAGLPRPTYPEISRRRGEQGTVVLDVEILASGHVGQIDVVDDAGHPRLAEAAMACLRPCTFKPALSLAGTPMRSVVRVPYAFRLEGGRR